MFTEQLKKIMQAMLNKPDRHMKIDKNRLAVPII